MPIDVVSGGTWIGINDAGLFFSLLNVNVCGVNEKLEERDALTDFNPYGSRGIIIPPLLACDSFHEINAIIEKLKVKNYRPFRLVFIDSVSMNSGYLRWDGRDKEWNVLRWEGRPLFYTSSELGDDCVFSPRVNLFNDFFKDFDFSERYELMQNKFHSHFWKDKRDVSVNMERDNALTVSRSIVEIFNSHIKFKHYMPPFSDNPFVREMDLNGS